MSVADDDRIVAALVALARHNIPPDIQDLLINGNPMKGIAPGALSAALESALAEERAEVERMLALCLERNCAWTTAKDSPNDLLLRGWEAKGWVRSVEPPPGLVAYAITPDGRRALEGGDTP